MVSFFSRWFARLRAGRRDSAASAFRLRLLRRGEHHDSGVAVSPPAKGLAFVAGKGARVYSLAAFRRTAAGSAAGGTRPGSPLPAA